ncbi:MAG: acyl-CoA thioesterase [Bdellovibrionales bacterium]|jgi:acyl-CoA thioester hydrolase|nr:acyl-CoA thioesterase [Bdellovibrionales bacterium]
MSQDSHKASNSAGQGEVFEKEVLIRESHLDSFGHVNNSKYLELFEEARWDIISQRGFGLNDIRKNGLGPVILEVSLTFSKEIRLREKIRIRSSMDLSATTAKTTTMVQTMVNERDDVCCTARFVFGLFSLAERKLVAPTPEWSFAVGLKK